MSQTDLARELAELIHERLFLHRKGLTVEDLKPEADLMDAFNIDSVELFEIVVALDEEYGVAVPEEEFSIELYRSINAIIELVDKYGDS
ncbi:MAG TPA: hypothetical protein DCZ72_11560 [Armatimonadetes bacterium]|nr:hypothetical protein [Armatimonadota bacterium]